MILMINDEMRKYLQTIFPEAKLIYSDLNYFLRKSLEKYNDKTFPFVVFKIEGIKEWREEFNLPLIVEGISDTVAEESTEEELRGYKLLPVEITYKVNLLSNEIINILSNIEDMLFNSRELNKAINITDKNQLVVPDPEIENMKYKYLMNIDGFNNINLKDSIYEYDYQYSFEFTITLKGILRKVQTYKILKHIDINVYFNEDKVLDIKEDL